MVRAMPKTETIARVPEGANADQFWAELDTLRRLVEQLQHNAHQEVQVTKAEAALFLRIVKCLPSWARTCSDPMTSRLPFTIRPMRPR